MYVHESLIRGSWPNAQWKPAQKEWVTNTYLLYTCVGMLKGLEVIEYAVSAGIW